MNYLVPIDFSDSSTNAAEYAAGLTKYWPGNVHLLHVITPIDEESSYLPVKTLNAKKNTVFEMFQFQEQIRRKFDLRTGSEMAPGAFVPTVAKTARKEKSEIIVMGTQGVSGLKEHLFGGHLMQMIENTTLPILAVAPDVTFSAFRHVAYVTDFSNEQVGDIIALGKIASKFKALLSVLSFDDKTPADRKEAFRSEVKEAIPFAAVTFRDFGAHHAAEHLLEATLTDSIDLLSISTAQDGLVRKIAGRSLSDDFVFAADLPILFLP